jgi:hypothetical protein
MFLGTLDLDAMDSSFHPSLCNEHSELSPAAVIQVTVLRLEGDNQDRCTSRDCVRSRGIDAGVDNSLASAAWARIVAIGDNTMVLNALHGEVEASNMSQGGFASTKPRLVTRWRGPGRSRRLGSRMTEASRQSESIANRRFSCVHRIGYIVPYRSGRATIAA